MYKYVYICTYVLYIYCASFAFRIGLYRDTFRKAGRIEGQFNNLITIKNIIRTCRRLFGVSTTNKDKRKNTTNKVGVQVAPGDVLYIIILRYGTFGDFVRGALLLHGDETVRLVMENR